MPLEITPYFATFKDEYKVFQAIDTGPNQYTILSKTTSQTEYYSRSEPSGAHGHVMFTGMGEFSIFHTGRSIYYIKAARWIPVIEMHAYTPPPKETCELELVSNTIPLFVAEILLKDAISKRSECAISMKLLADCESITLTSCYHLFETESIVRWQQSSSDCPVCREAL